MAQNKLTPTADQLALIEELKHDQMRFERDIAEAQRRFDEVSGQLKAAAVLFAMPSDVDHARPAQPQTLFQREADIQDDGSDLTAAVERIANNSPAPLSKKNMKQQLMRAGFPEKRLGNYFYTVIKRLKDTQRITILEDGRIWKNETV